MGMNIEGSGLVIGCNEHFRNVTTCSYSSIANSHILQFATARTNILGLRYPHQCPLLPCSRSQLASYSSDCRLKSQLNSRLSDWRPSHSQSPTLLRRPSSRDSRNRHFSSLHSISAGSTENTVPISSSSVASRGYRSDRVENTTSLSLRYVT
jgi:hypothetical protein